MYHFCIGKQDRSHVWYLPLLLFLLFFTVGSTLVCVNCRNYFILCNLSFACYLLYIIFKTFILVPTLVAH